MPNSDALESQQAIGWRVFAWGLLFLAASGFNAIAGPWIARTLGLQAYLLYPIFSLLGLVLTIGGAIQWVTGRGGFGAQKRNRGYMAAWLVSASLALFLCSLVVGYLAPS